MNGSRSTYMRKGYLLTALAAAVLLAASSGTAWAQNALSEVAITLEAPRTVGEGGETSITVRGTAMVAPTSTLQDETDVASNRVVTVDLELSAGSDIPGSTPGEFGETGQVNDAGIVSNPLVSLVFAENTGSVARKRSATGTITVRTNDDADAESERVSVAPATDGVTTPSGVTDPTVAAVEFGIIDDETQTYVLSLDPVAHASTSPPKEGEDVVVKIAAKPAHYQGGTVLTLQLSKGGGASHGLRGRWSYSSWESYRRQRRRHQHRRGGSGGKYAHDYHHYAQWRRW